LRKRTADQAYILHEHVQERRVAVEKADRRGVEDIQAAAQVGRGEGGVRGVLRWGAEDVFSSSDMVLLYQKAAVWRADLSKRTNFGIPNEINAIRFLSV
jgi:hypothetical protein